MILVIDDEEALLKNIVSILELEGYEVRAFGDPLLAIESLESLNPELILCDIVMPNIYGFEVLQRVRQSKAGKTVPFVFLSALSERKDHRTGMELGADDYLTKPFTLEELLSVVKTRLHRSKVISSSTGSNEAKTGFHPNFESSVPLEQKFQLTPREGEVLLWVAQGKSNAEIGMILGMAEKTVKKHLTHVFEKLGVEGRNAATVSALEVLSGS